MLAHSASLAVALVFCIAVIYGAISDVTTYSIPNWVSLVLVAGFAAFAALRWESLPLILHLMLGGATFLICAVFWKLKWLGGGDVKFLGAIALWMGPHYIMLFLILLSLLAAAFASLLLWLRRWNDAIQAGKWPRLAKLMVAKAKDHACPYGLPTAIAALTVAPQLLWPG